jgi:uncharacterized protein with HEPN domain
MNDEVKKLLLDILNAIQGIDIHLKGRRDYNEYLSDYTMRRAVERELSIIGEAVRKIIKLRPDINISFARQIIDTRNKVVHAYDAVNNAIVWKIIVKDISVLREEAAALLEQKTE